MYIYIYFLDIVEGTAGRIYRQGTALQTLVDASRGWSTPGGAFQSAGGSMMFELELSATGIGPYIAKKILQHLTYLISG